MEKKYKYKYKYNNHITGGTIPVIETIDSLNSKIIINFLWIGSLSAIED